MDEKDILYEAAHWEREGIKFLNSRRYLESLTVKKEKKMIECEYKCFKNSGKPADCKIRIIHTNKEINICYLCLEYLNSDEFEILERY